MIDYNTFKWPEITAETPLSEVKFIHWLIWDYVFKNGRKPMTPYEQGCVLCSYASKHRTYFRTPCSACPAKWPNDLICLFKNSLYNRWGTTRDPEIAKQIRDIPFKEDTPETIKDMFEKCQSDGTYTPTEWNTGPDVGKEVVE